MTRFEVAWTDHFGNVMRRVFNSHDGLCRFLEKFEVKSGDRATVKEAEA